MVDLYILFKYYYYYFSINNLTMIKLENFTSLEIRKMVSKFNNKVKLTGYSKMKKQELINFIRNHKNLKVVENSNGVTISVKEGSLTSQKKAVEKPNNNIKKELEKIVNNNFGRRIKYETEVLNGKLIDDSNEYLEKEDDANDQYEDDLMDFFKKNKLKKNEESKYFESGYGSNIKLRNLIKMENISVKTLSNYIKIGKLNKQREEQEKAKAPAPKKSNKEQLDEDLKDLYKYLKKSYTKNKPKLDKMTAIKYKNAVNKKYEKFITEFKDLHNDNELSFNSDDIKKADKRFYEIVPEEQLKSKPK